MSEMGPDKVIDFIQTTDDMEELVDDMWEAMQALHDAVFRTQAKGKATDAELAKIEKATADLIKKAVIAQQDGRHLRKVFLGEMKE